MKVLCGTHGRRFIEKDGKCVEMTAAEVEEELKKATPKAK